MLHSVVDCGHAYFNFTHWKMPYNYREKKKSKQVAWLRINSMVTCQSLAFPQWTTLSHSSLFYYFFPEGSFLSYCALWDTHSTETMYIFVSCMTRFYIVESEILVSPPVPSLVFSWQCHLLIWHGLWLHSYH